MITKAFLPLLLLLVLPVISHSQTVPQAEARISTPTQTEAAVPAIQTPASDPAPQPAAKPADSAPAAAEGEGPWLICDTEVKGLISVKPRVILKQVTAKKGELYERASIAKDIQSIVGLGTMSSASVDVLVSGGEKDGPDGVSRPCHKVVYLVSERPTVRKFVFKGNDELSDGSIEDAMSTKERDPFDSVRLEMDMGKIRDKYREKGYTQAQASFSQEPDPKHPNNVIVTITLIEGKQSRVKTVKIDGVAGFKEKKIIGETKNRTGKIYSETDLQQDQAAMATFYKNRGYQAFEITDSSITFSPDKSEVYISYKINEGPKSKFGKTSFAGNTVFTEKELAETLDYKRGKTYEQERYDNTLRAIQDLYADKGYIKMMVRSEKRFDPATGELDIDFIITENTVVYIDHVDVGGYKATKPWVIKREVVVKEGDVFRSSRIRKSQEKIMNLGFIDDVQFEVTPTADPDRVDVAFDVVEGKPGMMTMGAAVSSTDGLYGELSVSHLNFLGRAQRLSFSWQFGAKVLDYTVSWTTPWIFNKPISFGADVFNTRRQKTYASISSAYYEKRTGARLRLGPRFEEDKYQLNLAYSLEDITISDIDSTLTNTLSPGTSVVSTLSSEFVIDTRDNIWDPTRGMRNSVSFSLTGGPLMGQEDYYKAGMSSSYNKTLFRIEDYPFVWAIANRIGYTDRYGRTDSLPAYERYFIGGQDTVRGYDQTQNLNPADGGKLYYVFNTELRFPIAREKRRTIVQGAFFFDMGNAWSTFRDIQLQVGPELNQLKTGAGFGIRFTTPAFPIRLDWGYGFNHRTGDDKSQFYFTIGNMF